MTSSNQMFLTSRSRTSSLVVVKSEYEDIFGQLPDIIQEASVLTELELPDLDITDTKIIAKYGSDLTGNFAEIKAHGAKAFFQKQNASTGSTYSLCTCSTGYIWVDVLPISLKADEEEFMHLEIIIGRFALKTRDLILRKVPFRYRHISRNSVLDGQLTLLFSTVLGKYVRLRIKGYQYEAAMEAAILESHHEFPWLVNGRFGNFNLLLGKVCTKAPLPPVSDVSLISRSMIIGRWKSWTEESILRTRYFLPKRVSRSLRTAQYDATDLFSACFKSIAPRIP
ncbi:hypothetical protein B0O99DRAFT_656952 [Bisporella sp. PMI_857]|nr:hypothetical protein B0O99DRAFT_656952 [Bisporella sp. PMI_857]